MLGADDPLTIALTEAIQAGDIEGLKALLDRHPTLATERFGDATQNRSALHILTDWPGHTPNQQAIANLLAAHGADVNATFTGSHTETPLHWAASADDAELIHTLIDLGAQIEAPGGVLTGGPAIDDAIIFQQWHAAQALVERGATTALWHAAALGRDDLVATHLAEKPSQRGLDNALWHAAASGQASTLALVRNAGSDPTWVGWDHLTAAQAAERNGHTEVAASLQHP